MAKREPSKAIVVPPDWKLVSKRTRSQLYIGDTVYIDGVKHILVGGMPPAHSSSTGYVYVIPAGRTPPAGGFQSIRYYAQVAGATWALRKGSHTAKVWGKE